MGRFAHLGAYFSKDMELLSIEVTEKCSGRYPLLGRRAGPKIVFGPRADRARLREAQLKCEKPGNGYKKSRVLSKNGLS